MPRSGQVKDTTAVEKKRRSKRLEGAGEAHTALATDSPVTQRKRSRTQSSAVLQPEAERKRQRPSAGI